MNDLTVDCGTGAATLSPTPPDEVTRRAARRAEGEAIEVAEAGRGVVHLDLHGRARQGLVDNAAYLAIASPTNAQTLAQVRRLTRQNNALIRLLLAVDGARDLLAESTDV